MTLPSYSPGLKDVTVSLVLRLSAHNTNEKGKASFGHQNLEIRALKLLSFNALKSNVLQRLNKTVAETTMI